MVTKTESIGGRFTLRQDHKAFEGVYIMLVDFTIVACDRPIVDGKMDAEVMLQTCSGNYYHIVRYFFIDSLKIRYNNQRFNSATKSI